MLRPREASQAAASRGSRRFGLVRGTVSAAAPFASSFEASKKRGCTVQNYGSAKSGRAAVMDVIGDVAARYASTPPLPCALQQR